MNRKETLGRLLLTLLTAFVMVAGAFVAAVPSFMDESETSDAVAVRELDEQTRVGGEAPSSAYTEEPAITLIEQANREAISNNPDPMVEESPYTRISKPEVQSNSMFEETPAQPDRGTRAASIDAGGPYGTISDPLYEGEAVNFDATFTGDDPALYQFRWEVTGDGVYDGPGTGDGWGAYGEMDYDHTYLDNNVGDVTVQAWDGSWTTMDYYQSMWKYDDTYSVNVGGYYTYTYGNQFTVQSHDITVDRLGGFKQQYWASPYPYMPYYIYNVRLWTTGGTLLGQTGALYPADGAWAWGDIPDVTLTAGSSYIVAWHCEPESTTVYPYYYPHIGTYTADAPDNDEVTWDGYRYYPGSDVFPTYGPYTGYAWFCDIDYYWEVATENVVEDTATVFVDNVAPIVINPQASVSQGLEGSDVSFIGSFIDPGLDDDWEYRWDWGDGTTSDWRSVSKYSGGIDVLVLHAWQMAAYGQDAVDQVTAALGSYATSVDLYDYGPIGENAAPELEFLLQYDVILVSLDYYISAGLGEDMGDVLADYSDTVRAGGFAGGVVQMTFNQIEVVP